MRSWFVIGLALASVVFVAACTAGSGAPGSEATFGREDVPSFLRDDAGSSRDDPGAPSDRSGSACIACDQNYLCTGMLAGEPIDRVVRLSSSQGDCGSNDSVFACDGTVKDDQGKVSATWSALRGGGFRVCDNGSCIDCTPTDEPPTEQPQPTPGGNGAPDASAAGD